MKWKQLGTSSFGTITEATLYEELGGMRVCPDPASRARRAAARTPPVEDDTMPLIRIEPALGPASGRYLLEICNPHDAPRPRVTTPRSAAENGLLATLAAAASTSRETGG